MKLQTDRVFDLVAWALIFLAGLFAAYVCFGILNSQASGTLREYSVGGAIAGALVSWGTLTTIYLKLQRSTSQADELRSKNEASELRRSNEVEQLRKRVEELQSKLIRGAPHPDGFSIEVAERQSIVLARPQNWMPKGGTIFELELPDFDPHNPDKTMQEADKFPATFRCSFVPIPKGDNGQLVGREKYYAHELKSLQNAASSYNPTVLSYNSEIIQMGGEPAAIESLKIIARQFLKIVIGPSPDTGKIERTWWMISRDEYVGHILGAAQAPPRAGQPPAIIVYGSGFREGAVCYVNGRPRNVVPLGDKIVESGAKVQSALVALDAADLGITPRTIEVIIENPETDGLRTNAWHLEVKALPPVAANPESLSAETPTSPSPAQVPNDKADPATDKKTPPAATPEAAPPPPDKNRSQVVYRQVSRMRVVAYHERLTTVYLFDFWDDVADFVQSSSQFNEIIASTRFLD